MKKHYLLNGKELLDYSNFGGYLHKARKELENCVSCQEKIKKGEPYVRLAIYDGPNVHLNCYMHDHQDKVILAIGLVDYKYYGTKVKAINCKVFQGVKNE